MPISQDANIIDAVSSFYHAAESGLPSAWDVAFAEILRVTNCCQGSINVYIKDLDQYNRATATFSDDFHREYGDHFHTVNPFKTAVARLKTGQRLNRQESMADGQFRNTEFYSDYYRKYDVFHFEHQVFLAEQGLAFGISLIRTEKEGNFTQDELQVLEYLKPHLQRSFGLYLRISEMRRHNTVLTEAVDRIPRAVLAVDARHNIIFANRAAEDILGQPDSGLVARQARLIAPVSENNRKLKAATHRVFEPHAAIRSNDAGLVQFERSLGMQPLQIFVAPISEGHFRFDGGKKLALIVITDPEQRSEKAEQVLRGFYGLTHAEVRLATMLADGSSLTEASQILGVSMNTVRTHLKHIFAKTGTKRQGEIIKLIAAGPASLRSFDGDF